MLDHLGLGIVLTMQDDFTPQANKAVQSMDRMSTSAEQLERDMQRSMSNLQNIMLAGFSLNQVGGEFERTGKKILGRIKGIFNEISQIGADFETQQTQLLTAFKGDAEEARKAFDWVREYASYTPFDVKGLSTSFVKLKTAGMDIRETYKLANGQVKTLAESIGDLATRNMDSSTGGVAGMGYALQEAWAGQARSMRNRFNLASSDMEEMMKYAGKDAEKFSEEFMKLAYRLAPDAMLNMKGTWSQVVANMVDTWENFIYDLGQAGVFQPMIMTLTKVRDIMARVADNETAIKNIATILKDMWKPIDSVITGVVEGIARVVEFAGEHPMITKFVAGLTAFAGIGLVLSGTIMKLTGSFLILATSIVSAYANLQIMGTLNKVSMFSGLNLQIGAVIRHLGLLGIIAGIVALGFKRNVDGIRDRWGTLQTAWKQSGEILEMGASKGIRNFEMVFDRAIDNITTKLMKFRLIGTVIFTTLFGKTVNGALQYTEKDIENLRVMGLLPFAQTMAMIRGRVKSFAEGFETGITKAYEVAKNFLDFALIPIKAIFETLSNSAPIKAISSLFGIQSENGINLGDAQGSMAQFEKLGEIAGGLIGTLIGFKVVGSLTSIITKPFKGLFDILGKTKGATDELKDSMEKTTGKGSVFSRIGGFFQGAKERGTRAKNHFNNFLDERSELPTGSASSYEGYSRAGYTDVPKNFRDFNLGDGANPYNLYTQQPKGIKGRLSQALFGAKYYNPSDDGSGMQYVGRYGGRMSQFRDDTQTRLSSQSLGINPPTIADIGRVYGGDIASWRRDRETFIPQDSRVGSMMDIRGSNYSQIESNLRGSRDARIQELISDPQFRRNAYRDAGVSGRSFNMREADRTSFLTRYAYNDPQVQQRSNELQNMRGYASTNAPVFQARQNRVSQFLFGQRMYTPEQDEQGRWYERTVARRGGIFRNPANDMMYNDEGDVSLGARARGIGGAIANSRVGRAVGGATSRVRGGIGNIFGRVRSGAGAVGGFLGGLANAPLNALNRQRARLGWDETSYGGIARGLFGRAQYDDEGNMTDGGGLFSRMGRGARSVGRGIGAVGRGAGKVVGGIGRGIGAVGRGALRALPLATGAFSVGKIGYDAISNLGGDKGFTGGVDILRDKISNMDFKGVFDKFTADFKKNIGAFLPLVKDVFKKIAKEMPPILAQAWEGIKAGASLAWQFVSEHGMDILSGFVELVKPVIGFIWEKLKTGATLAWEWITTDGLTMLGAFVGSAVEWLIGTGIPMFIQTLLGIGKWLITDGIPGLLKIVGKLAINIGKGLFDGVLSVLGGIGTALGKIMMRGLKGALKLLLPKALEEPVFKALGLDYHHQGLWMSEDEHPAIIKKDETVLPPDKSRKLDAFLENTPVSSRVSQNQPQQVDNSITIEKVEVIVQADKLSRADARNQAKMILEEFKKLQKEKNIRQYA